MTEPSPEPTRPRRRRFTLSLRALMILVLLAGGLMGWKAHRARLQRRGVAAVHRVGGSVTYDWQYAGKASARPTAKGPPAPAWLRRALGDEYFQEVAKVDLTAQFRRITGEGEDGASRSVLVKPPGDGQLACLDEFDRLDGLVLPEDLTLDPAGLARLGRLTRLKELQFGKAIDPQVEAVLAKLTGLETLGFGIDPGRGAQLAFLGRMPRLRNLEIWGTLTAADFARIGRLRRLESLGLVTFVDGPLPDDGMAQLRDLKSLKSFSLTGLSTIDERGLVHFENLTDLETLNIPFVPLTDAVLAGLRDLPRLKALAFNKRNLSARAIAEFKAARLGVMFIANP